MHPHSTHVGVIPITPLAENQAQLAAKQMKKAGSLCHSQLSLPISLADIRPDIIK